MYIYGVLYEFHCLHTFYNVQCLIRLNIFILVNIEFLFTMKTFQNPNF